MNTVLASSTRSGSSSKRAWGSAAAATWLGLAALAGADRANAQDVAAMVPAAPSQSMVGRVAATSLNNADPAPRFTVDRTRLLESDRLRLGNSGTDPYGRPLTEQGAVTYRWWIGRGASNFGLGLGAAGFVFPASGSGAIDGPMAVNYTSSVLTVGYRYQLDSKSTVFADASGARRFSADADAIDRFSTKVGVEWKARSNKFGLDGAARSLSLQLDSGYRMAVKVRRNGFGIYVRGQF